MPAKQLAGAVLAALAAFVTLTCWAISSPAGSSPDELYHLDSIWCGHGIDEDTCVAGADESLRTLPHQVATPACFTQNPAVSADCRPDDVDEAMTPDASTEIGNWYSHGYPRIYYFVMSAFVVHTFDASVMAIRVVNCLLAVLLVAGLAWLLPRRLRYVGPFAFLATAVPLSLFTLASANPSSWATISAGVTWLAMYGAYEARGRRQAALLAVGVVAAVMGSGARTDGALFTVLGIALALGMRLGVLRSQWRATLVAALTAVVSFGLYFTSGTGTVVTSGLGGYEPAPATDVVLFVSNALNLPFLVTSALGIGPLASLGWFDTPMPPVVGFGSALVCGVLLFLGWGSMWWKKAVALGLLALALIVYPLMILQLSHIAVGNGVQPRYLLPMLVMFAGISLLPAVGEGFTITRLQSVVLIVLLSAAQSAALYMNLWRYVRGITGPIQSIGTYSWWWGGLFPPPLAVWIIGSCAFATTTALLLSQLVPPRSAVVTSGEATSGEARPVAADHPDDHASAEPVNDSAVTGTPVTASTGSSGLPRS